MKHTSKILSVILAMLLGFALIIAVGNLLFAMGETHTVASGKVKDAPSTQVSGSISADTTWTLVNSPYYVSGTVAINSGVTLTIEPGVVVKFAQNTGLIVSGSLNATGNSGSKIYFTDYRDDSVGGDTNGDGAGSSPAAGWWARIEIEDGGSATLDYCEVRYGGAAVNWGPGGFTSDMFKTGAGSLSLTNSTLRDSSAYGLWILGTTATHTISGNTIRNNAANGIQMDSASNNATQISSNTINNNTNSGIYLIESNPTITGNTFSNNAYYGISMTPGSHPTISGNTFTGNTVAPLGVSGGNITADTAWNADTPYYLEGTVSVATGKTLTIPAGKVIKFAQNTGLIVSGSLNATGNSGSKIYFTDYRDDSVGGDTNGDSAGSSPAVGWWARIDIEDGGSATLDYCEVRYGGSGGNWGQGYTSDIFKTGAGSLSLTNSTLRDSNAYGLWILGTTATHTISGNTIRNNAASGIQMDSASNNATQISNNTISNNTHSGIYLSESNPTITGNTFSNNAYYGIYMTPGSPSHHQWQYLYRQYRSAAGSLRR